MSTVESRTITMRIERPFETVYGFMAEPESFSIWASGLGTSLRHEGGEWKADGPEGPVTVRFTPRNAFGIVDHTVRLTDGMEVSLPIRVIPNGDGSEVLFTLFRLPGMDDATFVRDVEWVTRDLETLRRHLEG